MILIRPTLRYHLECGSRLLDYPELGMEAMHRIDVEGFLATILVDDKGNHFFAELM